MPEIYEMKFLRPPRSRRSTPQPRFFPWLALLLLFSLTAHSLDVCAAHIGISDGISEAAFSLDCKNPQSSNAPCAVCSLQPDDSHNLCEVTSESSTAAARGLQIYAPLVIFSSPLVPPADLYTLAPLSGIIRSRDGPDVPSLYSVCCGSTLLGRSPPLSA